MISPAGSKLGGVTYPVNEHAQKQKVLYSKKVVGLSVYMAYILLLNQLSKMCKPNQISIGIGQFFFFPPNSYMRQFYSDLPVNPIKCGIKYGIKGSMKITQVSLSGQF